jgi:hypothetical protein
MSLNFPDAPTLGQTYPPYIWDGEKWDYTGVGAPGTANVKMSDTPPPGAVHGDLWYESDSGFIFVRVDDGSSLQWAVTNPVVPVAGPQGIQGVQGVKGDKGDQGIQGIQGPIADMTVATTDVAPVAAGDRTLWWNGAEGVLYIRYRDVDSVAWVQAVPSTVDLSTRVRHDTAQGLTTTQQTQANTNIAAVSYNAQTLTAPQQTQARKNIDADSNVRFDAQVLTAPQQAQARTNIGVAQVAGFDTSWKPFAYLNGWLDYAGPFGPCGYRMLPNGMVILRGIVKNGTDVNILTLPAGYRPGVQVLLSVGTAATSGVCRLDITTAGLLYHTGGNNQWISLNGINFLAEL